MLTPNVDVPMKTVRAADFSGMASKLASTNFNLSLRCDAGINISYQFDGARPAGVSALNVLSNTFSGSNAATGVGIALYRGADSSINPVNMGQPISYGLNNVADAQITLPFTAWYYQNSAARPTAGKVLGVTTVTFTYK